MCEQRHTFCDAFGIIADAFEHGGHFQRRDHSAQIIRHRRTQCDGGDDQFFDLFFQIVDNLILRDNLRCGIGIATGEPLYVVRLDPQTRHVVVGPKAALSTRTIPLREVNWLGDAPLDSQPEWHLRVKVRSTRPPAPAILRPISATEAEVELMAPEDGVSAGQACVFYAEEGSRVLGGGWIWRGR